MIIELRIKDEMIAESIVSYLILQSGFSYDKNTNRFINDKFSYDMIPKEYLVGSLVFKGERWIWIDHGRPEVDVMIEVRNLCK